MDELERPQGSCGGTCSSCLLCGLHHLVGVSSHETEMLREADHVENEDPNRFFESRKSPNEDSRTMGH